jgi:hypothetical protein
MYFVCLCTVLVIVLQMYYKVTTELNPGSCWAELRSHPVLTSRLHFLLLQIKVLVTPPQPLTMILCNARYPSRKVDMTKSWMRRCAPQTSHQGELSSRPIDRSGQSCPFLLGCSVFINRIRRFSETILQLVERFSLWFNPSMLASVHCTD